MQSIYTDFNDLKTKKLLDNFYFFDREFSDSEVEKIKKLFENTNKVDGNVNGLIRPGYRKSKISWINRREETAWIYDRLAACVKVANKDMWNFNIVGFGENIQLTEYETGGQYDWHLDIGESADHRKISVSVQLSDENSYIGGDLQIWNRQNPTCVPRTKGTVITFPSYLLHRVSPITQGKRLCLICWITGEPFR